MKIYTKTGDRGTTGLFGGARVSKAALRVEAYGSVDELNSVLGLARAETPPADLDSELARIQCELFDLGAELASVPGKDSALIPKLGEAAIEALEQGIDRFEEELAPLQTFILPGGSRTAATLHLARTVCRRAERRVVALHDQEPIRDEVIRYLNRLSDFLFVAARLSNHRAGVVDVAWVGRERAGRP